MKRLIVCCDGTWNRADQESEGVPCATNVIKLAYRIAKRDGDTLQVLFYDQGVGTGNKVDKIVGGAVGKGLDDNIFDAYRFLIANYEPGDEIYIFGFSRGAFTARSLGGMIRKCGIIKRETIDRYRPALDLYRDPATHPNDSVPVEFRKTYAIEMDTPVRCIGVFDTVGALGIPVRGLRAINKEDYEFHDTQLSRSVKFAFHALAIDEQRSPFEPTLWTLAPSDLNPEQVVEQVWFTGVHSDVGGGYPQVELSDITLDWMIRKASSAGLKFDAAVMAARPIDPTRFQGTLHDSRKGVYNLTPALNRPIGLTTLKTRKTRDATPSQPDPTQSVHPTVRQRWDADPKYRPPQLREYFKRTGDPRGR